MKIWVYQFNFYHGNEEEAFASVTRAFHEQYSLSQIAHKLLKKYDADEVACVEIGHFKMTTP